MPEKKKQPSKSPVQTSLRLNEDWLAVILAFVLILLATLGLLGEGGLLIPF